MKKLNNKGISLIVLVITIIVMIILAGVVVMSLSSTGIIDKATAATKASDLANIKALTETAWAEAYANGARSVEELTAVINERLRDVDTKDYNIKVTPNGPIVNLTNENGGVVVGTYKNEYGFYFDMPYYLDPVFAVYPSAFITNTTTGLGYIFHSDGTISMCTATMKTNNKYVEVPMKVMGENLKCEYSTGKIVVYFADESGNIIDDEPVIQLNIDDVDGLVFDVEGVKARCNFDTVQNINISGTYLGYMYLTNGQTSSKSRVSMRITSTSRTGVENVTGLDFPVTLCNVEMFIEIGGETKKYSGNVAQIAGGIGMISNLVDIESGEACPYIPDGKLQMTIDGEYIFIDYISGIRDMNSFGMKRQY